ncbi:MAG TPA: FISUMP domain-containing protein [Bacteroidia bacterium]|jgi:uncharacterized protein (TIGR02145 family)|nr:FISUMP domain-containing protein [Bacteroidia bacterium]
MIFFSKINSNIWVGGRTSYLFFSLFYFFIFISHAQNIAINESGATANTKSILEIQPDVNLNKGLLVPRLTTAQRNTIAAPIPEALLIYNTTSQCFEAWNQNTTTWVSFGCIGCQIPGAFSAYAASNSTIISFDANWDASAGATGYYIDVSTSSSFSSFVTGYSNLSTGNVTSYSVNTNLSCGTTYYYRVRATNACGTSANSNTITASTSTCGPSCNTQVWSAMVNINTGTQIAQGSTQAAGQKWCYNDVAANCTTYGGLYQWASAMNLASTANSAFQYGATLPSCDPCNSGGIQGICPTGYHIPTDLEWSRYEYCIENTITPTGSTPLATFQTTTTYRGSSTAGVGPGAKMKVTASNSPAWDGTNTSGFSALPTGYYSGAVAGLGTTTLFWSATENTATTAFSRLLTSGNVQSSRGNSTKTFAFPVRCLKN